MEFSFMDEPAMHSLYTGASVPTLGMGSFGLQQYAPATVAAAFASAGELGYRMFDCAADYAGLGEVGEALRGAADGRAREAFFFMTSLPSAAHGFDEATRAITQALGAMRLDHFDLAVIRWPFFQDEQGKNRPYAHSVYMETWRALESMCHSGVIGHIGTCNMTVPKLEQLLRDVDIAPCANLMELHPTFRQKELFDYCMTNEMLSIGFGTMGAPGRPPAWTWEDEANDLAHPTVLKIAKAHEMTPAQVLVSWGVTRGHVPLVFSTSKDHLRENMQAASRALSDEDMRELYAVSCGNRLIRGTNKLWQEGLDWHKLWDTKGGIERK